MSDETRDRNAAQKPTEADVKRWRSQLEGLAQRRREQTPAPRDTTQEILPPESDRRARLRDMLRNRQGNDAPAGGGRSHAGGTGAAQEGDAREQLVRRALQNRRNQRGDVDQAEGDDGRLLRRLREARSEARSGESRSGNVDVSKEPLMSDQGNGNRPLGVGDIPGALRPDGPRRGGENASGGGPDRAKVAEFLRRRGGMGGAGERGGQQGGGAAARELQGRRGGQASGDPIARGRELLDRLKSRLNESSGDEGGQSQRLAAGINLIDQGYKRLEDEVERLKNELADAEEKLRVLLDND